MDLEKINNIYFDENYYIKEEWPEITFSYLPQDILIMLKKIFAGVKGEFTAVTEYSYENYILWSNNKLISLSNAMEKISIQEMKHYEILAKIFVRCGIDPKCCVYIDGNPNLCDYWKASNLSYEKTLVKMFENNILLEERTIEDYNEILSKTDNQNFKDILLRILKDEQMHLKYFKDILQALKK